MPRSAALVNDKVGHLDGRYRCALEKTVAYVLVQEGRVAGCIALPSVKEAEAYSLLTPLVGVMQPDAKQLRDVLTAFNSSTAVNDAELNRIRGEVESVKNVMLENIDKALDRGEHLESVQDKSASLVAHAAVFKASGRRLRTRLCRQNAKWVLFLSLLVCVIIFVIFLIACRGFMCVQ